MYVGRKREKEEGWLRGSTAGGQKKRQSRKNGGFILKETLAGGWENHKKRSIN